MGWPTQNFTNFCHRRLNWLINSSLSLMWRSITLCLKIWLSNWLTLELLSSTNRRLIGIKMIILRNWNRRDRDTLRLRMGSQGRLLLRPERERKLCSGNRTLLGLVMYKRTWLLMSKEGMHIQKAQWNSLLPRDWMGLRATELLPLRSTPNTGGSTLLLGMGLGRKRIDMLTQSWRKVNSLRLDITTMTWD